MSIDLQSLSNMLDLKKDVQILVTDQKYIAHSITKVNPRKTMVETRPIFMKKVLFIALSLFLTYTSVQGQSLQFNGSNYATVPHDNILRLVDGDFTIEAWINPDVVNSFETIASKGGGNAPNETDFFFSITNTGKIGLAINDGTTQNILMSNTSLSTGQWQHVAVSYDRSTQVASFYLNGVADGTSSTSFTPTAKSDTQPFYIGQQGYSCQCNRFNGLIDELRIWDTNLPAGQIKYNSLFPLTGSETNLLAYYQFNEESGTSVNDETSNNRDATLVNSPSWSSSNAPSNSPYSNYLFFSGLQNGAQVSSFSAGSTSALTVEAVVKIPYAQSGNNSIVEFGFNNPFFGFQGGSLVVSYQGERLSAVFNNYFNKLTHVAFSVNGSSWKLYINGTEVDSDTRSYSNTMSNFGVGKNISKDIAGFITDVRIWNDERTETEILTNMFSSLTGSESNLRVYYDFSEGSGTSLNDGTANNYDATFIGYPIWMTSTDVLPPIFSSPTAFSFNENKTGNVTDFNASLEVGNNDTGITYGLSGTDASFFDINTSNGIITLDQPFNYEEPIDADVNNAYEVTVSATGNSFTVSTDHTVTITDVVDCDIDQIPSSNSGLAFTSTISELKQTFKACGTGQLSNLKVLTMHIGAALGTIEIEEVTGYNNGVPISTVIETIDAASATWQTAYPYSTANQPLRVDLKSIIPASGVTLYEGTEYIIDLSGTTSLGGFNPIRIPVGDTGYTDGLLYVNDNPAQTGVDLFFEVSINESGANNAPIFYSDAAVNFPENATEVVLDVNAKDESESATRGTPDDYNITYTISGIDASLFSIDSETGALSFQSPPDFENHLDNDGDGTYELTVTADDGLTTDQSIAITVTNVFENVTFTTSSSASVAENTTVVTTLTAEGANPAGTLSYSITSGDDQSLFSLNGADLSFTTAPDFEVPVDVGTDNTYEVQVTAEDGFTTDDLLISVSITDEDEAPVAILLSANTLAENGAVDDVIGTLSVENPDAGDTHTFLIDGGTENTDFKISGDQLLANRVFDFETEPSIDVTVTAKDATDQTLDQLLSITITNANDAPTDIQLSNLDIAENTAIGTVVATLTTTDQDASDSHTYSLQAGIEANDDFEIVGNELKTLTDIFDFETDVDHIIRVQTEDGNSGIHEQDFTLSVTDVNEAPVFNTGSTTSIEENTTVVATLDATDMDAGSAITYSVTGGDDQALFIITGSELAFTSAQNFESPNDLDSDNTYKVQVSASDGTNSADLLIDVAIIDSDEAPVFATSSSVNIDENTSFITLEATDEDTGSTITYSILGGDDQSLFSVTGTELSFNTAPDFEAPSDLNSDNTYEVQVSASDGLNTTDLTISIAVDDVNEAPVFTTTNSFFIEENSSVVATLDATDVDAGSTLTYSVSGGDDQALFTLTNSELSFLVAPDFEVPTDVGSDNVYNVQVSASDGVNSIDLSITVEIIDFSEPPVGILLSSNTVAENGFADQLIGTLSAENPDAGDTHSFFVDGVGTLQNADFRITGNQLFTNRAFDFETESAVSAMLYIRDGDNNDLQQTFTIEITDANDVPTAINLSSSTIEEALPVGTEIGILSTIDPDAGDTHTYTSVAGFDENYAVNIVGNSLQTAIELNFDVLPTLNLKINVNDGNGGVNEFELMIDVTNVNQAPTGIVLSNNTLAEDDPNNTIIGILSTLDEDDGDTHSYSVLTSFDLNGEPFFPIVAEGANLVSKAQFDFESISTLDIEVQSTDADGLSFVETLTIQITDVNEGPTAIALSNTSVDENVAIGTVVGTLSTTDEDAGDTFTYEIANTWDIPIDGVSRSPFAISGSDLVTDVAIDYEYLSSFLVMVRIISTDASGAQTVEDFTITVNDLQEGEPQTITFDPIEDKTFDDAPFELIATASSNLSVSFTSSDESVLSISGMTATILAAGEATITATQEGSNDFNSAAATQTVTINKASQAITFEEIEDQEVGAASLIFSATTNSGLAIAFTVSGPATLSGNTLTIISEGEVTVTASQEGDSNYLAAEPVTQSFLVTDPSKTDQTITFEALQNSTFGDASFDLLASVSSELPLFYSSSDETVATVSGSTVTIVGAGETVITASQGGNDSFNVAESVSQTLIVEKANQLLDFALQDKVTTDDPFDVIATSDSGLPVTISIIAGPASISDSTITLTGNVGIVELEFSQAGNNNYNATSLLAWFTVSDVEKQDQVITFDLPSAAYISDGSVTLNATSNSGLDVEYEIIEGVGVATINNGTLEFNTPGTVVVVATQFGDDSFNPAVVVVAVIQIKPVFTLTGTITAQGSTFNGGTLVAIGGVTDETYTTEVSGEGDYTLENLKDGDYYFGIDPTNTDDYYSTYYGDEIFWEDALVISVINQDLPGYNIEVQTKTTDDLLTGNGVITGRIIEDDGSGGRVELGRILEGTAIPDVSVFLIRTSDDQIMTEVLSDANGDFEIAGIPEGDYRLKVEVAGAAMDLAGSTVAIDAEGTPVVLTAMVGEDGISLNVEPPALGIEDQLQLKVYPNPAVEYLNLELEGAASVRVFNLKGQTVLHREFAESLRVDVSDFDPGLYFLEVTQEGMIKTEKFIKIN